MRSEAKKLLYSSLPKTDEKLYEHNEDDPSMDIEGGGLVERSLPDFSEMVIYLSQKASARLKSRNAITYGTKILPFDVISYSEVGYL